MADLPGMFPLWAWAAGGALLGAIVGSFLAVLVVRWPQRRSVAAGRSVCDGCGVVLRPLDLIPLASFAMLHGRCRRCGTAIDPLHPAMEAAGSLIGLVSLAVAPGAAGLAGAVLGWGLLALAALDLRHFWLPDKLTLPLLGCGLAIGAAGIGPSLNDRLIGAAAGYLVLRLVAFAYRRLRGRHGLGGGDAKLLAAIGAGLGWRDLPLVLLLASLAGIVAVLVAISLGRTMQATTKLPFGPLLAGAAWLVWLASLFR
jgi:leader peptidase (prepilin peptidase)/N-methyltransferase